MLAGAHLILGNAVALSLTKKPLYAFLIGFITHHIFDLLPHLDRNVFVKVSDNKNPENIKKFLSLKEWPLKVWILFLAEIFIGIFLFLFFSKELIIKNPLMVLSATIGALLPDIFCAVISRDLANKYNFIRRYFNFHKIFHYYPVKYSVKEKITAGIIEVIIIFVGVIILLNG